MSAIRDQGDGEYVPGRGADIVAILMARRPHLTTITFADGTTMRASTHGFVRDIGDDWEKLYLGVDELTCLTCTSEIISLQDPESGAHLYAR